MTQEALKLLQEVLAGLKDVEKQVHELVAENKALKEALAQLEQEPVMHTLNCVCGAVWDIKTDGSEEMVHTPPRKPLTDEQKMALCKQFPDHLTFSAIHAIEAAHGIKE